MEIGLRPGEKMFEELRLDGETTTRTKNNLIFKNNVMDITMEEINEKLKELSEVINEEASNEKIKECILRLIKDKETVKK